MDFISRLTPPKILSIELYHKVHNHAMLFRCVYKLLAARFQAHPSVLPFAIEKKAEKDFPWVQRNPVVKKASPPFSFAFSNYCGCEGCFVLLHILFPENLYFSYQKHIFFIFSKAPRIFFIPKTYIFHMKNIYFLFNFIFYFQRRGIFLTNIQSVKNIHFRLYFAFCFHPILNSFGRYAGD